jgi:hypothetical protein
MQHQVSQSGIKNLFYQEKDNESEHSITQLPFDGIIIFLWSLGGYCSSNQE